MNIDELGYDLDELEKGGGFIYPETLIIGPFVLKSSHDYLLSRNLVHSYLLEHDIDEGELEIFDLDLGTEPSTDSFFGIKDYLSDYNLTVDVQNIQNFNQNMSTFEVSIDDKEEDYYPDKAILDVLTSEFSLDAFSTPELKDDIQVFEYEPSCPPYATLTTGLQPPRPPSVWNGLVQPLGLLLSKHNNSSPLPLKRNLKWGDLLSHLLPDEIEFPSEQHFTFSSRRPSFDFGESGSSPSTLAGLSERVSSQTRSNSRPRGCSVFIIMSDNSRQNIGTHSMRINKDLYYSLDFRRADESLAELFSAVGGEGIGCATGSHDLHQMVSAILSTALEDGADMQSVDVEINHDDIVCVPRDSNQHELNIDITSTSGIWKKPLKKRRMIAVSKYDIAACFLNMGNTRVTSALALAIMNCLAVEHTAYYGLPKYKYLDSTLTVHYQISDRLHELSYTSMQRLSEMSYHAVIKESVSQAIGMDPFPKGEEYKGKAARLKQGILDLKHQDKIAIPPYPISEIIALDHKHGCYNVAGQEIFIPSIDMALTFSQYDLQIPNSDAFIQNFEAVGIAPYADAMEMCSILDDSMMTVSGMIHKGPCHDLDLEPASQILWDSCSAIYSRSSIAQFAEIRADLVKFIDLNPVPNTKKWKMCRLYKNKVLAWYRLRDSPTDPRGYRVDWFAVSKFEVLGSKKIKISAEDSLFLWPRQRLRSQEMELCSMLPRRLKLTLFAMLEKARAVSASVEDIQLAWQRLAITATSSTWASGATFITCRHLSSSFSSPSAPFDSMVSKFKPSRTLACCMYYTSVLRAINRWTARDTYFDRCAILNLPRSYMQIEAYWQVWIPDELADSNKHMTDCALALFDEYLLLESTKKQRDSDAHDQLSLLQSDQITFQEICESIRKSCSLDTGGKLGWSVFGALASAWALSRQGDVKKFDIDFSRGKKSRRLVDHLTVRHSARIDKRGKLQTGTVAEMIIENGIDDYLSILKPTYRFFYGHDPIYINHPKNGELKDREISIADPDSRIMLNNAELINGSYGKHTSVDMLKRPDKDAYFYKISSQVLLTGGAIQASDASRFSAMMSNISTGITNLALAAFGGSAHLLSSAATYRRLASRRMLLSTEILEEVDKRLEQDRGISELNNLNKFKKWIKSMNRVGTDGAYTLKTYRTAVHTGQGMSHHGTSLMHGGALLVSLAAAEQAQILIGGRRVHVAGIPMVTSDDSTIVAGIDESLTKVSLTRSEKQRACQLFLKVQREVRKIALRSVSVMANLPKEKVSGIAGEFNSQDNGIGLACPILGFREMICQLVRPSSGSLINDLLNSHSYAQTVALSGQGLSTGIIAHRIMLDALKARWRFKEDEYNFLLSSEIVPNELIEGCDHESILMSATSMLPPHVRRALLQMSHDYHLTAEDVNPHSKDSAFSVMNHVSVAMRKQHEKALKILNRLVLSLEGKGMVHQAMMLNQSITSTMSSARTRNIGRIGQRIRSRYVKPRDFLQVEFSKAQMMETTLTWYDHIGSILVNICPSPEIVSLAATLGSRMKVDRLTYLRFPQPATKRRSKRPSLRKPVYVLEPYGQTPFGRHAVIRSGAILIERYSQIEKSAIQNYIIGMSYRKIQEHVQYGDKFTVSWLHKTSGTLTSVVPTTYGAETQQEATYWGSVNKEALSILRDAERDYENIPILALNYAYGSQAHFHGIWKNNPYSCSLYFNPDQQIIGECIHTIARGGMEVIACFQGWSSTREWAGNGPTAQEIESFQFNSERIMRNNYIQSIISDMYQEKKMNVPMLACKVVRESESVVYMVSSPYRDSVHMRLMPYERSKIVGNMATGGYWYSSLKGVAFRAFLKDLCGNESIWPGPVLGWRTPRVSEPMYAWEPPDGAVVKSLTMIGGIDREEDVSILNPIEFGSANVYVDHDGMHMVDRIANLAFSPEVKSLIMKINGSKIFFTGLDRKALLLDTQLPAPVDNTSESSVEKCIARLHDIDMGIENVEDDW